MNHYFSSSYRFDFINYESEILCFNGQEVSLLLGGPKAMIAFLTKMFEIKNIMFEIKTANLKGDNVNAKEASDFFEKESCFQALKSDDLLNASKEFVNKIPDKTDEVFVIGMGGSYIATKALYQALAPKRKVDFLNSIDLETLEKKLESASKNALFLFVSKSGSTSETLYIYKKVKESLSGDKKRIAVITEENEGFLYQEVKKEGYLFTPHPKDIGGRFSVFSPVSFVPLLWAGVNVDKIIEGAKLASKEVSQQKELLQFHTEAIGKEVFVIWPYKDALVELSKWWAQIWAESIGKEKNLKGDKAAKVPIPLVCNSSIEQHSLLQHFMENPHDYCYFFLKKKEDSLLSLQCDANYEAMEKSGFPVSLLEYPDLKEEALGYFISSMLYTLFYVAETFQIDPYGQEGVELSKKLLKKKNQELKEPFL